MSSLIWGPKSREFDPRRWLLPDPTSYGRDTSRKTSETGPGVWPNILTFIDGPRRCVGYKLGIMEIKIMLFVVIRNFVYAPVAGQRILKWNLCVSVAPRERRLTS